MDIVSYSEARNNLKAVLDRVSDDYDFTVITRRDAPDAVIMSKEQFDSWQETINIMSSPKMVERLNRSMEQYKQGKAVQRGLIDE